MKNELKENIENFIEERISTNYKKLIKNNEYKTIEKKYNDSFKKIESKLTKENDMLEDYKSNEYDLYDIQLIEAYKRGFIDSLISFMEF